MRVIYYVILNKLCVWDNDGDVIEGMNFRRSNINLGDISFYTGYVNAVSNTNRTLEHDNKSGYEICSNILQAKSNSYGEKAENNSQTGEINPHKLERDKKSYYNNNVL